MIMFFAIMEVRFCEGSSVWRFEFAVWKGRGCMMAWILCGKCFVEPESEVGVLMLRFMKVLLSRWLRTCFRRHGNAIW